MVVINATGKDIITKLVLSDFTELAIARMLITELLLSGPQNFTLPILDMLKYNDNYFCIVISR